MVLSYGFRARASDAQLRVYRIATAALLLVLKVLYGEAMDFLKPFGFLLAMNAALSLHTAHTEGIYELMLVS